MTPAIEIAKANCIDYRVHEYQHDPSTAGYGPEAAIKLKLPQDQVFKTLVCNQVDGVLLVAVLPVSHQLSLKAMAEAASTKKVALADKQQVQRVTGYVLGGVSPLGQKKKLQTIIDESAECFDTIYISAGRRGLEIELSPSDLKNLTDACFWNICA